MGNIHNSGAFHQKLLFNVPSMNGRFHSERLFSATGRFFCDRGYYIRKQEEKQFAGGGAIFYKKLAVSGSGGEATDGSG